MDCDKLSINLHQVTQGPRYKLDIAMQRPANKDIASVVLVMLFKYFSFHMFLPGDCEQ